MDIKFNNEYRLFSDLIPTTSYESNSPVGVMFNGRIMSLNSQITCDGSAEVINAFDYIGRRIYRQSLCFLLEYSSHKEFPDKNITIGYSLGDGFFFKCSDDSVITESEFSKIKRTMAETVKKNLHINSKTLPLAEAKRIFHSENLEKTELLISYRNTPELTVYELDGYYSLAVEPVVPDTGLLTVWDLIPYRNGMLLRYPTSGDVIHLAPFRERNNLYKALEDNRQWSKTLGIESIGQMNQAASSGKIRDFIRYAETLQRSQIYNIALSIANLKRKAVFICGPSSSGKTTFAKRVCEQLNAMGYTTIRISLDDYYKPKEDIAKTEYGDYDLESIDALNVDMFANDMKALFSGKAIHLPIWDFVTQTRSYTDESYFLSDKSVFVIEGLHGLNPVITGSVEEKYRYAVYISALTPLNVDDHHTVHTTDNRIIRRIIRDYRTRGNCAAETLNMWYNVERGERKFVFPNQENADVIFNSALDYELGVLAPYAIPLLKKIGSDDPIAYAFARKLLAFLDNFYSIADKYVPSDSILREFIGGSDYE